MGIDPSVNNMGWAVISHNTANNVVSLVDCGLLKPTGCNTSQKAKYIYNELNKVIGRYQPSVLAVEEAFKGINAKSALQLSFIRGIAFASAFNHDCCIIEIHPKNLKKYISGSGQATKEQVAFCVKQILNISGEFASSDVSDAAGLAICAHQKSQP